MTGAIQALTPTYSFALINFDYLRWHPYEQGNWSKLDGILGRIDATSSTVLGMLQSGAVQTSLGKRNYVINPNGGINQRFGIGQNAQVAQAGGAINAIYTADRWCMTANSSYANTGLVHSTIPVSLLPSGTAEAMRVYRTQGNVYASAFNLAQVLPAKTAKRLQGKLVTLSVAVRAGAGFDGSNLGLSLDMGTGVEESSANYQTGQWSGTARLATVPMNLTAGAAGFTRYAVTTTVPANATELAVSVSCAFPNTAAPGNDYIDLTEFQLEVGAYTAAQVIPENSLPEDELARCAQYYQEYTINLQGVSAGAGNYLSQLTLPRMRSAPMPTPKVAGTASNVGSGTLNVVSPSSAYMTMVVSGAAGATWTYYGWVFSLSAEL